MRSNWFETMGEPTDPPTDPPSTPPYPPSPEDNICSLGTTIKLEIGFTMYTRPIPKKERFEDGGTFTDAYEVCFDLDNTKDRTYMQEVCAPPCEKRDDCHYIINKAGKEDIDLYGSGKKTWSFVNSTFKYFKQECIPCAACTSSVFIGHPDIGGQWSIRDICKGSFGPVENNRDHSFDAPIPNSCYRTSLSPYNAGPNWFWWFDHSDGTWYIPGGYIDPTISPTQSRTRAAFDWFVRKVIRHYLASLGGNFSFCCTHPPDSCLSPWGNIIDDVTSCLTEK